MNKEQKKKEVDAEAVKNLEQKKACECIKTLIFVLDLKQHRSTKKILCMRGCII